MDEYNDDNGSLFFVVILFMAMLVLIKYFN